MLCTKCSVKFKPCRSGVSVVEMFGRPPQPYKIWDADLWQCPGCGTQIVAGFASAATEHYEQNFPDMLTRVQEKGYHPDYERVGDREGTPK